MASWGSTLHPDNSDSTNPVGTGWNTTTAAVAPTTSDGGFDSPAPENSTQTSWESMAKQMEATLIHDNGRHEPLSNGGTRGEEKPFPPPEPSIAIEEVWPDFLEVDKTRDLDDVKPALARLCEAFKGHTWTELENKLREDKCNTYLVATEHIGSFGYTLVNLRGEPNQEFRVIPSFIKPGTVKKGRMALGMAQSYEDNVARLDKAGVVRPSGIPRCLNCKEEGHMSTECPEERREPERSEFFGKCYNCGSQEHRSRTCPEPRKVVTCNNCQKEGHMARECPEPTVCNRCGTEGHSSRDCSQPRTDIICRNCNQPGHVSRDCDQPRTDITCRNCNQPGHMARDCDQPRTETDLTCYRCNQIGHGTRNCLEPRAEITCNRCNQPGHMARDCDQPRTDITCRNCNQPGHMSRDCKQPRTDITCRNCNQPGHMSRDCDQPRQLSSVKCHRCEHFGHRAVDCTNEAVEGAGDRRDRRPPRDRLGFSQGFF